MERVSRAERAQVVTPEFTDPAGRYRSLVMKRHWTSP